MIILELYNQSITNLSLRLDFKAGYGKYWTLYIIRISGKYFDRKILNQVGHSYGMFGRKAKIGIYWVYLTKYREAKDLVKDICI